MAQTGNPSIQQLMVRQQLERLLSHKLFARSDRMGRFLRLTVERTLAGRGDELKEYLIGVEVFDRKSSYDPRVDPIVRVEARRLRSKLKAYYEGDGNNDPILIEFLTGTYAPQITDRTAPPADPGPRAVPGSGVITTAVMPLVDLSPNSEHAYFSDGLTEELIHALTKLPGMRVVAWNTVAKLRDFQGDMSALRRQLNAETALTGSVRISGASLRVRAQLIDTETGVYLWSETFDRQMQDVFAIQEEIAMAIVRTLRVQLGSSGEAPMVGRSRTTLDAYEWYLKGRHLAHRRTPEALRQSLSCFENALAVDPDSALAHAGVADSHSLLVDYGLVCPEEGMPKARAAAERSIELDPELAESYVALGFIRGNYDWQWEESLALYRRAIILNPGYVRAHHWLGCDHYAQLGRFEEGLAEVETAIRLDPLSSIACEGRAYILMLLGRYQEAVAACREILANDPAFYKSYATMGRVYSLMGDYEQALAMFEKGRAIQGDLPSILGAAGQVAGWMGDTSRARAYLTRLEEVAVSRYVPATPFALVHLGLGDKQAALSWLEKGCERRDLPMTSLKIHPAYDAIRGEPRFTALLKRLNFI